MGGTEMDDDFPHVHGRIGDSIHRSMESYLLETGTLIGWHYLEAIVDDQVSFKVVINFRGEIVAQVNDTTFLVKEWVPTIRVSTGAESGTETKILNLAQLRDGLYFKTGHEVENYISFIGWRVRDAKKKFEDENKKGVQDK